jgi:hypothetical protein
MFTYQGRLHDGGSPAGGPHDFVFDLFDSDEGGVQVGGRVQVDDVELVGGHFTVGLDFGAVFDGRQLWLQIGVRPGSSQDVFTTLSPRQRIGATPYAQKALNDSDALAAMQCAPGQIPKFVNGRWTCANDETEVIQPAPPAVEIGNWKVVALAGQGSRLQAIVRDAARGGWFDGSLIYLDNSMTEGRRIDFFDALPVSYTPIDYTWQGTPVSLAETLEFKVGGVRLTTAGVSGGMIKKLFANQFVFEVNGKPVANVLTVEPGAIAFNGAEAPLHTELPVLREFPPAPVRPYGFTVDLPRGLEGQDSSWKHIGGGALEVVTNEEAIAYRFGDVTVRGDLTQRWERKELIDWINAWTEGDHWETDGELVLYNVSGIEFMSVLYVKVRPVLYRPPSVDASTEIALVEELTFRAMMIE